jgi:hypothetical protein
LTKFLEIVATSAFAYLMYELVKLDLSMRKSKKEWEHYEKFIIESGEKYNFRKVIVNGKEGEVKND